MERMWLRRTRNVQRVLREVTAGLMEQPLVLAMGLQDFVRSRKDICVEVGVGHRRLLS